MKRLINLSLAALSLLLAGTTAYAQPDSLWSVRFGSRNNDHATAVYELDDGAFLIGCNAGNGYDWNASLLMFSPSGDSVWGRVYKAPRDEFVKTILPWFYGGYMLCGWSTSFSEGFPQFYMLCVDRQGTELWKKTFGEDECLTYTTVMDENADYYFLGTVNHRTEENGPRNFDARIMKISATGDSLWTRDFGDQEHHEYMKKGIRTDDGGFAITGSIRSLDPDLDDRDVLLMKFDRYANLEWSRSYGTTIDGEEGFALVQTPDGGYIVTGFYRSSERDNIDGFALKFDAEGDSVWFRTVGTIRHDYIKAANVTRDGNVILTGYSGYPGRNYDYKAINIDYLTGETIWEATFGGPYWDVCYNSKIMSDGSLIMLGESQTFTCDPNHLIPDSWVIKVGTPPSEVPVVKADDVVAQGISISGVTPNPFNSTAIVSVDLADRGAVEVTLTDLGGRTLRSWTVQNVVQGENRVKVDGSGLTTGTYWLSLKQNERTVSKKLTLLR